MNEKCVSSLPLTEYLPALIAVHAVLIFAPHYLWKNAFGARVDSFFHLVSDLARIKDPGTGDYPENNYVILKTMEAAFGRGSGARSSNSMFWFYLLKLGFQLLFCVGSFLLVLLKFNEFDETFPCPRCDNETLNIDWPLPGETVMCVFTPLHQLRFIWLIYLILVVVATVCLTFALIWLVTDHMYELGIENVAEFSFQTSLPFNHYIPRLTISKILPPLPRIIHSTLSCFPFCSLGVKKPIAFNQTMISYW